MIPDLVKRTRIDMIVRLSFYSGAAHVASEIEPKMATDKKIGIAYFGPRWWYKKPPPIDKGMSPRQEVRVEANILSETYFM